MPSLRSLLVIVWGVGSIVLSFWMVLSAYLPQWFH